MRVAVLTGGSTPERDVALAGAAQVVRALRARGHEVGVVDTVSGPVSPAREAELLTGSVGTEPPLAAELAELRELERRIDLAEIAQLRDAEVVFLVLHGREGEGGQVQTLLERAGLTYTGSGSLGSAIAMDKDITKRLLRDASIPTPEWRMWPASDDEVAALGTPVVVKPSKAGSTVGLTVVRSLNELPAAVEEAYGYDDEVMLERYLTGREFTVGVLGDEALAVGEIIPSHEIFDYECKYTPGMTQEVFPAEIEDELTLWLRQLALSVHRVLKLDDFSRVDFRLGEDGTTYCLEVNTLPGLTATSLLPQSGAAAGIGFEELCERICELALRRAASRNKVVVEGM
ncbi:MAG: D-alanine--D-alanine ligase [Gemmatimonadales bacterium]